MAAGPLPPEDLDLDFLLHPDPPSPSVFLDLPPVSYLDDDDMVLPYISHMLMEEDDHASTGMQWVSGWSDCWNVISGQHICFTNIY